MAQHAPQRRAGPVADRGDTLHDLSEMGLPWLVVLRGSQIRPVPSRPDVGVGRKRQAETYTELDLALLGEDRRRS